MNTSDHDDPNAQRDSDCASDTGESATDTCAGDDAEAIDLAAEEPSVFDRHRANVGIRGRLTLHYATRDVVHELDGTCAIRIMSLWQNPPEYHTPMNPLSTPAILSWVGVDLDEVVVGVSWRPNLSERDMERAIGSAVAM